MSGGFDEFVLTRGPALLRFAHVLCGNAHLAEDLVQEVLARVHRRWDRIDRMQAPEAYVRRAVVREFLSWRRRSASRETVLADLPDRPVDEDLAQRHAARDEMWSLLAGLPRAQRAVLVLRFYDDLTDNEIGDVLGCAPSTVRAYSSRALTRLRTALRDRAAMEVHHD
jgi:RNA polymerase sigma-70 factor (sigma-E family)